MEKRIFALVPGVPALLPEYASLDDPVADLRSACLDVVAGLGPRVRVAASHDSGLRVGGSLVTAVGAAVDSEDYTGTLVVANGSAKRTEKAPGHFDGRAEAFDARLRDVLLERAWNASLAVDEALAAELWADVRALQMLVLLSPAHRADVRYDAAPYGVQYWVIRWD